MQSKLVASRENLKTINLFHCDDMLFSFESTKQQFLSFSLSSLLLSYQSQAFLIQQTISSLASNQDDSLQRYIIDISNQIRQDDDLLVIYE